MNIRMGDIGKERREVELEPIEVPDFVPDEMPAEPVKEPVPA